MSINIVYVVADFISVSTINPLVFSGTSYIIIAVISYYFVAFPNSH